MLLFSKDTVVYELYVVQRLLEELQLAEASADPIERSVHEQASRYYRDLLHLFDGQDGGKDGILKPPPGA